MAVFISGRTYLRVKEAARLADVHEGTIRRWIAARRLDATRTGCGQWVVDEKSLRLHLGLEQPLKLRPVRVAIVGVSPALLQQLAANPQLVHALTPEEFEEFVCDRFSSMGLESRRVGPANARDGGIDLVFWPRSQSAFPFLGAAQVKHHREPRLREGPSAVRDFAGAIAGHPFNAGIIVTNSSFTPDARWYASERARLIRLREFPDICRWILDKFDDEQEWREIPSSIEVCPGVTVKTRG